MKRIVFLTLLSIFLITGCSKEEITNQEGDIPLSEETWIDCQQEFNIEGSNDTFEITSSCVFNSDEDESEAQITSTFAVTIDYKVAIDQTTYEESSTFYSSFDNIDTASINPKYNIEITNFKQGQVSVLITKK